MDVTLREYIENADAIHNQMINNNMFININDINNKMYELEGYIKQIQSVSYRIGQIYYTCKKIVNSRPMSSKTFRSAFNPMPSEHDWSSMVRNNQHGKSNDLKDLSPDIKIKIKQVDTVTELPNMNLYWVKSLRQFAFCLNGVIFRGNIGKIFLKNEREYPAMCEKCKYGSSCKLLSYGRCRNYHDPVDVVDQDTDNKNVCKNNIRNYINASWLYSAKPHDKLRTIGNRETLKDDIIILKHSNRKHDAVDKYLSQTMHDILVCMALNQEGLIYKTKFIHENYDGGNPIIIK